MNTLENRNTKRKKTIILLLIMLLILIASLIVFYFWQSARLDQARWENQTPQVVIEHPAQGQILHGDQFSFVSVIAGSKNPIRWLELWVDGQFVDMIESETDEGIRQMGRVFDFFVDPGAHTIVVQAVDTKGLKGQSHPVSYTGSDQPYPGNTYVLTFFDPGMSIDQLGEQYQIDPAEIIESNPEVFGEGKPGEGPILVPINSASEEGDGNQPAQPASEASPGTFAAGKICFPSQVIPAMTAYFQNTKTKAITSLPIQANQTTYSVPLYPGTYIAYAWSPDMSMGGSYSKAVPCGLDVSCTDHAPLPFNIQSGTTTQGIDICDWYHQPSVPNPPFTPGGLTPSPSGQVSLPTGIPMLTVDKLEPVGNANSLPWAVFIPSSLPDAPTNLKAGLKDCKIQLTWTSDSTNVSEYQVWYSAQNGLLNLKASLKPPQSSTTEHWYEFLSPSRGVITVWVDAINAIGVQSSNPASVTIPTNCGPISSDNLAFDTLEVEVNPGYDRVYLYLSLEGIPEQRIPSDDNVFIQTEGGRGDFGPASKGEQKYILPLPKDEMLTVEGECWGWSGGTLNQLSKFSEVISADQWDGKQGRLGNEQCSIGYELQANYSSGMTYETFAGKAGGIPAPFNVKVQRNKLANENDDPSQDPWAWMWWFERDVYWQWKGDIKEISGFTILLNGSILKTVPAKERMATVQLPWACGSNNKWTVIANGKNGKAPTSQPFTESILKCSKYAKIEFGAVRFNKTCDDWVCWWKYHQCDTLETYFTLSVNNFAKSFYGGNTFMPLACGKHSIPSLLDSPNKAVFILPYHDGYMDFDIKATFWDHDKISGDDYIGPGSFKFTWPSFQYGESQLPWGSPMGPYAQYWSSEGMTGGLWNGSVRGSQFRFNIYLYPNKTQYNP